MKHRRILRVVAMAALLGLATGGAAAAAPSRSQVAQGVWTGRNSQGLKLKFDVLETKRGLVVQPTELDFILTCSATGTQIEAGFGFIGFDTRLHDDGTFSFHLYD